MQVKKKATLENYNTFGIKAACSELVILEHESDIPKAFDLFPRSLIIGGGSNLLLVKNPLQSVILNRIRGIQILDENEKEVTISVGSGHNWHELVLWAVDKDLGGIENLSLIPGTVGAGPIQNIGAYGSELRDVLLSVQFYDFRNKQMLTLSTSECKFGYRDSIFKNQLKNQGFISKVVIRLTKAPYYKINTSYKALADYLDNAAIPEPGIRDVSRAVIKIRESKLPDWKKLGNAGSFFKNPEIDIAKYEAIRSKYPEIPSYPVGSNTVKIPAAWLIQSCGFKGIQYGNVGCYLHQPLVIVNYGNALPSEIMELKNEIQKDVLKKFDIRLLPEVTIIE